LNLGSLVKIPIVRWDPNRENETFFKLSACLYANYYHLQILVHRPFIPTPGKPSPLSYPSLAICTNAARSCSHVVAIQQKRGIQAPPYAMMAVFTSAIVLLLNIWGGKKSGLVLDSKKEMADVHKCMRVLKSIENQIYTAGRICDVLTELASAGDLPLPESTPSPSNKRDWEQSGSPGNAIASGSTPSSTASGDSPRPMAGLPRATKDERSLPAQSSPFSLPMYSQDLGRLPLYGQNKFLNPAQPPPPQPTQGSSWYSALQQFPQNLGGNPRPGVFTGQPLDQNAPSYAYTFPAPSTEHSSVNGLSQGNGWLMDNPGSQSIENDTISMWTYAPTGFELEDWGSYVNNVNELSRMLQDDVPLAN
jgi:hypothetical protein